MQSPRAMAKFHKEALRLKQVLSANTDHFAQVSLTVNQCNIHPAHIDFFHPNSFLASTTIK